MTVRVIETADEFRNQCEQHRLQGRTVALVPTLGALHPAHQSLIRTACRHADVVAVSVFVNPTQFGPGEDFEKYPRDLPADVAACEVAGASLVFAPRATEMYPPGARTRVLVDELSLGLCGAGRPGHFEGVATIVAKLLALTGPCVAVFGRKDYQQLKIIQRLVRDLLLPAQIVEHDIVREADGLAQSSRNRYLDARQREVALAIPRALSAAVRAYARGERDAEQLVALARGQLGSEDLLVEYLQVVGAEDLLPVQGNVVEGGAGLFVAARVGATRLIDNVLLGRDADPMGLHVDPVGSTKGNTR